MSDNTDMHHRVTLVTPVIPMMGPVIGITPDVAGGKYEVARVYATRVADAGGIPIVLSAQLRLLPAYLEMCDGFVLTGGDDPDTAQWGEPIHPKAKPIDPDRQAFEAALLEAVEATDAAVLGVCLGMQLMALQAGGHLDQHLPDSLPTAADHWGKREHRIDGPLGSGIVHSHHRQAVDDAGSLEVVARAPDGVIEAVDDPRRPCYLGVQWHPERTASEPLGQALFERLVAAARDHARRPGIIAG